MPTSLFQYEMLPTTWFYLSSLLILAVFFRFNRVFSVRNLDVLALIAFTPGMIYLAMGATLQGYVWLFVVGTFLFCRIAADVFLRRRPLLDPNLSFTGLAFSCVASSAFIIPNLFINRGDACESPRAWRLEQIIAAAEESEGAFRIENWPGYRPFIAATQRTNKFFAPSEESWNAAVSELRARKRDANSVEIFGITFRLGKDDLEKGRPATRAVQWAAGMTSGTAFDFEDDGSYESETQETIASLNGLQAAKTIPTAPPAPTATGSVDPELYESAFTPDETDFAEQRTYRTKPAEAPDVSGGVLSLTFGGFLLILFVALLQLAIVAALVLIGKFHFGSLETGFACALLYLLLPYINQFSARLDHIVPALAILLAVLFYRRPVFSGIALGVAGSLVFYPFFLIPIWLGFYWKKGLVRFAVGLSAAVLTLAVALLFIQDPETGQYGKALASMFGRHSLFLAEADGLWEFLPRYFRIPIIGIFGVYCLGSALWIPRQNLATLVSCSAALMLGVQFWMGRQGGLYMSWYLPLVILTVFRPNLDDRTAVTTVVDV
jgi:hypothetical protein